MENLRTHPRVFVVIIIAVVFNNCYTSTCGVEQFEGGTGISGSLLANFVH